VSLIDNIEELHRDLLDRTYAHDGYYSFFINDPKRRHIHKACVRDRLLHHAIYRLLYPFFDRTFISDSFSCRVGKGVYKAIDRFDTKTRQVSKNHTKTCWVLKCDIRKFFDSIDHNVLLNILAQYIRDKEIISLLENVINSYHSSSKYGVGLPLCNLTSQLFANVYMNVFDQWVKHNMHVKHYIRYADDFVFISDNRAYLESLIEPVRAFLSNTLHLKLHPSKVELKTIHAGMDFLGWIHFPYYKKIRRKTKERMFGRLVETPKEEVFQSYLGLLGHGNTYKVEQELRNMYWMWRSN
jgi:RNA-directed DNA polymerase